MCSPRRCIFPTGEYPPLPSHYSPQLSQLVADMLQLDAAQRPSVADASHRAQAMLAERVASKASRELTRGERRERLAAAATPEPPMEPPMAVAGAAGGSAVMGAAGVKGASRVDEPDAMPTPRRLGRREADALLPQPSQPPPPQQQQHSPPVDPATAVAATKPTKPVPETTEAATKPTKPVPETTEAATKPTKPVPETTDPATAALDDPTAPPSGATPRPAGVKRTDPATVAIPPPPPSHSDPSPAPSQLPTGVVPLACVPNIAAARAELPPSRGSDASAVSLREQRLQQRALERRRPSTSGSAGAGAGAVAGGGGRELWMPATAPATPQLTQSSTPQTSGTPPGVTLPEEHRDWSAAEIEAYVLAQQMQRLHARAGEAQQALLPPGAPMPPLRPGSSTASSASGASRPTTAQSNRPPHLADTPAKTPQGDQFLRIRKERVARLLSPASAPLQPAAGATRPNGKDGGFAGRYDIISGDYRI